GLRGGARCRAARGERRAAAEALAERIEREGVAAFLDRWLAGPLFATLPEAGGRPARGPGHNTPRGASAPPPGAAARRARGAGQHRRRAGLGPAGPRDRRPGAALGPAGRPAPTDPAA